MSKIGRRPIAIPNEIEITVNGQDVTVKGPKGKIEYTLPQGIKAMITNNTLVVNRLNNAKPVLALHGTWRAHLQNAVQGVLNNYRKELELVGLGYRAELINDGLNIRAGFSHPIEVSIPEGITVSVEKNRISVEGISKQKVGLTAARIRQVRPPEPYKGTGIRYVDEIVRKKAGKAAKAVGAAATG